MLSALNEPGVNISTVEDPVEYTLDGIHQVQVIREKGLDFSRALRSLMRQDPDIILVGETRDKRNNTSSYGSSVNWSYGIYYFTRK